jgi:hypothetical protein
MEYTAGLIPLDSALAQMLSRVSPLTESETTAAELFWSRCGAG